MQLSAPRWLARGASRLLRRVGGRPETAGADAPRSAPPPIAGRPLNERLAATLGRGDEALSPRALRRILGVLQAVNDASVSEVEAGRRASSLALWYARAPLAERRDVWLLVSEKFANDPALVRKARDRYEQSLGTAGEVEAEIALRRAFVSPRARLLQRFAAFAQGMRFLVDLRAELLPHVPADSRLRPLDAELEQLFSTWFDVAFLELRRITWDSPASLIEKLIRYEAVHDVRGWSDMKNRLDSDRRCYGFFHPRLEGEPLIFVEVALVDAMAGCITPLLDEAAALSDPRKASAAIFYSISNTQPGLRGVSFGDSLIKRVVETLRADFPRLKTFATLSPIPGLRAWAVREAPALLATLDERRRGELARELGADPSADSVLAALEQPLALAEDSPLRRLALSWSARYLGAELREGRPLDPVARFHLGNGARIERLNWAGDPSAKGLRQSWGVMVNYLYDLRSLDRHRAGLARGQIPMSGAVQGLYP